MHNQPHQPLSELEALRKENAELHKYLRTLLSETYVIRATVEAIITHQTASEVDMEKGDMAGSCFETDFAGILENALEACHLSINEDDNESHVIHVHQQDRRLQTFSIAEWEWMYDDGTWPWEHKIESDPTLD